MRTFHYLPPGPEEQRGFVMQFLGTLLGLGLIALLWLGAHDITMRGVLLGAGAAALFKLGHAAWGLEQKAQRSQNAEIGIADDGLHLTDASGQSQVVPWTEISECAVQGGRLTVRWTGGQIAVGAREMQDGMTLVQEVLKKHYGDAPTLPAAPSNFIPLTPR